MDNFKKYYSDDLTDIPYPSYHKGDDLESTFIKFYFKNKHEFDKTGWNFIPVKWTNIYNKYGHLLNDLQKDLLALDDTKKYFTVSQHDDAPNQKLPTNTLNFSAGGNRPKTKPIPLICSPISFDEKPKDIFCSFVGSVSGPTNIGYSIRMKMMETLVDKPEYVLKPKHWSPEIDKHREDLFIDITSRSKFTLCPRGYGATSFRLYEAMQMGSVPVYIFYKEPFLPFTDDVNWQDISVLIEANDIAHIDHILKSINEEKYNKMLNNIKHIYSNFFTLESLGVNILKILKK